MSAWTRSLAFAAFLAPSVAWAGNGTHPRTPVIWEDPPCLTVVDRSVAPSMPLPYAIPFEDTEVTPDEVEDSRRHQFFAFCRQQHSQEFLPNWISQADVDAAVAKSLISADAVEPDEILELAPAWTDCYDKIIEDGERRPITFEQAEEGVVWDVAEVPAGVYVIAGYTYEPPFSLWAPRPGVVKVVDDLDQDVGPAAAIMSGEQLLYSGDVGVIEGCVDAPPGSTMTGYYASTEGAGLSGYEPQWVPFAEDVPVDGDSLSLEFIAPEEEAGNQVMIRVDVTDPNDQTYQAFQRELIIVIVGQNPDGCGDEGGLIGNPGCDEDSGEGTEGPATDDGPDAETGNDGSGSDASSGDGPGQDGGAEGGGSQGCGCSTGGSTPWAWLGLGCVPVVLRRRRRSTPRSR